MVGAPPPLLQAVNVQVTARCNVDCACCFQPQHRDELPAARVHALIDEVAALGSRLLMLSGGEPTLRPELALWIRQASDHGLETRLATNATTASVPRARRLLHSGLGGLHASINVDEPGRSADKDARIRDRTLRGVQIYVDAGLHVVANLIVTRRNIDFVEEHVERLQALGIRGVNLLRPHPSVDRAWFEDRRLGPAELYRLQRLKLRLHRRLDLAEIALDCSMGSLLYAVPGPLARWAGMRGCVAGTAFASVDARGEVYACPDLKTPELSAGNLRDQGFTHLWHTAPIFQRLRQRQLGGACGECHAASTCGGCRAIALHDHGDPFGPDSDCAWGSAGPIKNAARLIPMVADFLGAVATEFGRGMARARASSEGGNDVQENAI
jgi:radical SAM protein with 4Fe4S-binding SPASM domain